MSDQLRLTVKDFRAIKEADIKLNGITVVTGVNGSGKSTISKLLYKTIKTINNYDELVIKQLDDSLYDILRFIYLLEKEVNVLNVLDIYTFFANDSGLTSIEFIEERQKSLINYLDSLFEKYKINLLNNSVDAKRNNRLLNTLKSVLSEDININNISILKDKLYLQINNYFNITTSLLNSRPAKIVQNELIESFSDSQNPRNYSLLEYEVPIYENNIESVSYIHSLDRLAYIDTPMQLGSTSDNEYWNHLNDIIEKSKNLNSNYPINNIIKQEILKGDSVLEEEDRFTGEKALKFRRQDGYVYDLLDVATGVKSFAILQLLLKNGFLNKNTLLIIDEPEVHLHPQWIVEYARIIVLLNKEVGVKFFIASHSPDMVSAIKYICEKEGTADKLEYYLAKESSENSYRYIYNSLGTNIEPIFNSFNIALDRINQYGISKDDDLF